MAKTLPELSDDLITWIGKQPLFFVATAPLAADGHVNLSPKGLDSFRVLDAHTVAYLDYTGSGAETLAHLGENGRMTVMFCAFEGPPRIVRLYGQGRASLVGTPAFTADLARLGELPPHAGARAVITLSVSRIADSCGYSVPKMALVAERDVLDRWAEKRGEAGLAAYRQKNNRRSIDGLPAFDAS